MAALAVCLASLALLPLAYRLGVRRCLRQMNGGAWEVAEGFRRLQAERQAAAAQREIIELGTRKLEEMWQRRQPSPPPPPVAPVPPPRSTQYHARTARPARVVWPPVPPAAPSGAPPVDWAARAARYAARAGGQS
jgi:hypothetical protein